MKFAELENSSPINESSNCVCPVLMEAITNLSVRVTEYNPENFLSNFSKFMLGLTGHNITCKRSCEKFTEYWRTYPYSESNSSESLLTNFLLISIFHLANTSLP